MSWFPTIPGWDGIHPAMVMFPVVLLFVTPVLIFVSLFARGAWRSWAGAALVTLALGAIAAWMAVGSGHAAGQLIDKTKELEVAILRHEALGVTVRNAFTGFAVVYLLLFLLPRWLKWTAPEALRIGVYALFLVAYVAGTGMVAHAADAGGRLVHERGLHASVYAPTVMPTSPAGGAATATTPAPSPAAPGEARAAKPAMPQSARK